MNPATLDEEAVAGALASGALLLTATSAQAADWKRRIVTAADAVVVQTPAIHGWPQWLAELIAADLSLPVALNRLQEAQLWERVIRADLSDRSSTATSIRGLARHAMQAWEVMQECRIDAGELAGAGEEAEALARWIDAMHEALAEPALAGRGLAAELPWRLLPGFAGRVAAGTILLDGFDRFTPLQSALLEALQQGGIELLHITPAVAQGDATVIACADEVGEMEWLTSRVAALLQEHPDARIALLTGDSIRDVEPLGRVLDRRLLPIACHNPADQVRAVVMPAGSLFDAPMIRQLLFVLGLAGKRSMALSDCSRLLLSPWLKGYATERAGRAALDGWLRRRNMHHLSIGWLLGSGRLDAMPGLTGALAALNDWKVARHTASAWVGELNRLLQLLGFLPSGFEAESRYSDAEIRLINTLRDLLASLVCLDALGDAPGDAMSWSRFLAILRSSCAAQPIQHEVAFPNVVMMPFSQAAGLKFDAVLLAGFDEAAAPMPARSLPLIPLPLQQKYQVRQCNATLAYERAAFLWQSVCEAAPRIEIGYARVRGEQECRPSPFTAGCGQQEYVPAEMNSDTSWPMEPFEDALPVPLGEGELQRGGTAVIRDQSACPFRAFARHRLGLSGLEESTPGIEPTTKGSLLHLALEELWRRLQSADRLHGLDEEGERQLIEAAIAHAWEQGGSVTARLQAIESRRMQSVLKQWLQIERGRPPFQVLALEQEWRLRLPAEGPHRFDVRIKADRIDRDGDGRRILIDYKSGAKQRVSQWIGERIEEPQLPLYALAADIGHEDAVSFASLRAGEMGFEGLAGEDVGIDGIAACDGKRNHPEDWDAVLQAWRAQIDQLATEFANGECRVSPRDAGACRYCSLEAVCRIEETGFDIDAGDEA